MKKQLIEWEKIFAQQRNNIKAYKYSHHSTFEMHSDFKMGKMPKQTCIQRKHRDGQQAHVKYSTSFNHQRKAN